MLGHEILPIHDMYKRRVFACIIYLLYTNITFKEIDFYLVLVFLLQHDQFDFSKNRISLIQARDAKSTTNVNILIRVYFSLDKQV